MKATRGFTVIELLIVVGLFAVASVVFFTQKNHIEVAARDDARKTAINAMYYGLEEVYFKQNQSYPRSINAETLPSVDPDLFKDPNGVKIGEASSDYRYEAVNCSDNGCAGYTLRSSLEAEDDYIKQNRD
ncbi:type II secretion system GspH family protein [Candidatus Saccharibacteria bacterium]|nr:type II secretion system GspH family protein [Candidatus Saccharibacteria bacterium]